MMTFKELVRDAEDMAKRYPNDRLRLSGPEVLVYVAQARAEGFRAGLEAAASWVAENTEVKPGTCAAIRDIAVPKP